MSTIDVPPSVEPPPTRVLFAIAKMLPKLYLGDWRRRRYERAETRSIHPDAPV